MSDKLVVISFRLHESTLDRIDQLTRHRIPSPGKTNRRYQPFKTSRSELIRRAIDIGLDRITAAPAAHLRELPPCPCSNPALLPMHHSLDTASSARLRGTHSAPS